MISLSYIPCRRLGHARTPVWLVRQEAALASATIDMMVSADAQNSAPVSIVEMCP
jgi:hypothetical protein